MKNNALKFGLLSGIITTVFMVVGTTGLSGSISWANAEVLGYVGMLLAFSMIFIGIYKERESNNGIIAFLPAFKVGIIITAIASIMYVATWMIITNVNPSIEEGMFKMMEENLRNSDLSAEQLKDQLDQMETWKGLYENPISKMGVTLIEIFPLGLVMSLVAALVFKRKQQTEVAE